MYNTFFAVSLPYILFLSYALLFTELFYFTNKRGILSNVHKVSFSDYILMLVRTFDTAIFIFISFECFFFNYWYATVETPTKETSKVYEAVVNNVVLISITIERNGVHD